MSDTRMLANYNGQWITPRGKTLAVPDPATGQTLAFVPLSEAEDVARVVEAASAAFRGWRQTPPGDRVQFLFRLKTLLEQHFEELAKIITAECGKTLAESRGEVRRGIENVEVACGIPLMLQGYNSEDIAPGIDEIMIRQPLGVVAAITPFNFPAMIPLWFLPYAIACGNTFVLKPSERVPITAARLVELIAETGLPAGVVNLVHGDRTCVEALLAHPAVRAISFVGSSPVARHVYATATANGKRAQCQGGAKNAVVVLPDADLDGATSIIADSAFGCAGQRCLAASIAVTVGDARGPFTERIADAAATRVIGPGTADAVQMGPVITRQSQERIEAIIERGIGTGARPVVDGRGAKVPGHEGGYFLRPTVLDGVPPASELARTEVFGPVLSLTHVDTVEAAIELVNGSSYGNMACLFTSSGAAARKFRYEAQAGNIGINLGVAAPMAFFPFSGWRDSFFGDLHGQGRDAVEFYTDKKVVVERWPAAWSRRF
jgi:malonate-semialdehyde dehydrogenase (acetylating) / methylmalonate-semialdehyde dehydrogenase